MDTNYRYYEQNGIGIFEFLHDKLNFIDSSFTVEDIKNIISKKSVPGFVFNLTKVTSIDSVGIGYLIAMKNAAVKKKSKMLLVSDSDLVLKVLNITRVETFFKIFRTMEEALASASTTQERS